MRTTANITAVSPDISITISLSNGKTIDVTRSDLIPGSLSIKSGTSRSGEFQIGGTVMTGCDFMLDNHSGKFTGVDWYDSRITVKFTFGSTTLNIGYFYIVKHNGSGWRVKIEAYDALKVLNEYQIYERSLKWPMTASAAASAVCSAHGLSVSGMRYPNMTLSDPGNDTMSERQLLSYIAEAMGQFVRMDGDTVKFGWYDTSNVADAGVAYSANVHTSDITVTGVEVTAKDGETKISKGTSGYRVNVSGNPFITADNADTVAGYIYNAVNGIKFRPGTVSVLSNAAIEPGDCIRVEIGTDTVTMLATTMTYKPSLRMSITADADGYDGDLRISRTQRAKAAMQDAAANEISRQLGDPSSDLSQAIGGSSGGSGGKIGGVNNSYGTIEQYDDQNEQQATWDKDGLVFGAAGRLRVQDKRTTQTPGQYREFDVVDIHKDDAYGNGTKHVVDIGHGEVDASGKPDEITNVYGKAIQRGDNTPITAHSTVDIDPLYEEPNGNGDVEILRAGYGSNDAIKATGRAGVTGATNKILMSHGVEVRLANDVIKAEDSYGESRSETRESFVEIGRDAPNDDEDNHETRIYNVTELHMLDSDGRKYTISIWNGQLIATPDDW